MPTSNLKICVPGKLMVAGEYAILEPKQHAIVIAVDRYITAQIERSNENILSLPQLGLHHVTWSNVCADLVFFPSDARLAFIKHAVMIVNQYFQEQSVKQESYKLTITSQLADHEGRKYGLGSSAAIVVGVVTSILSYNHVQLSREQIFKLSALAHLKAQGNGSGADIAASVFGGWIHYSALRPDWVLNKLKKGAKISDLIKTRWPELMISPLIPPSALELAVGWTKETARTGPMIKKIQGLRLTQAHMYEHFLQESSGAVSHLLYGFESDSADFVLEGISQNHQALRKLGELAQAPIETPKLTRLCQIAEEFGTAKISGAGGGDCGIAVIRNKNQKLPLHDEWKKAGIVPLSLNVSKAGFVVLERTGKLGR